MPKMGHGGEGYNLQQFQSLYRNDPFYTWFGLDNPLMYRAHKAAGGMTSVYRQLGIGCERLFRRILQDSLGLSPSDTQWSYEVGGKAGKSRSLHLDGRIPVSSISNVDVSQRVSNWIQLCAKTLGFAPQISAALSGAVFEVRQGYKSKDAKRQNADINNASLAITQTYLPCIIVLSSQIDTSVAERYRLSQWILLTGSPLDNSHIKSTYSFMRDIIGYDLAAFFERNSKILQLEVSKVLDILLSENSIPSDQELFEDNDDA